MTEQELLAILKQLAQAREEFERNRSVAIEISRKYDKMMNEDLDFVMASEKMAGAKEAVERLEAEAKQMGVDLYKANPDGGKALIGGNVKIKDMTNAVITDALAAREWATANAPSMIILDEKAVINHAKAVLKTVPLPFVKITTEPVAQIASKLEFKEE